MLSMTLNGYLIGQQASPTTKSAQPASKAPATTGEATPPLPGDQAFRDQIREQVRAAVQGRAAAAAQDAPAPPAPPDAPRRFTIRGPNGEETVIGMPSNEDIIPPQAVDISLAFFFTIAVIIIGLPLARAFARRMDRKGVAQMPNEVSAQLAQLNQAVDAIALEVERISEGQRFTTRLLSEQRESARQTLPSGADR
jgi:hypothetical protein